MAGCGWEVGPGWPPSSRPVLCCCCILLLLGTAETRYTPGSLHSRSAASRCHRLQRAADLSKRAWLLLCGCKLVHHPAVSSERCQRQESVSSHHPLGSDSCQGGALLQLHCLTEAPQAFIPIPCSFPGVQRCLQVSSSLAVCFA